ncbi:hypothetical protein [Desulfothermobacter acidiphilus]|uniref:hypothetical protein n=1 Tax=Desulfothermobacter acidiphilus TaxID=1938353 RepID=UPI003F8CB2BF
MLPAADLYSASVYARNQGLLATLTGLYAEIPEPPLPSRDFCRSPAPAALVEFLHAYRQLRYQQEGREEILRRTAEFYFLELVDPEQVCPFHREGECLLGPAEPLLCRLLRLLTEEEFNRWEEERIEGLKAVAERFQVEWGVQVPEAVLSPRAYPGVSEQGRLTASDLENYRLKLMELDARVAPPDMAYHRFTLFPIATHLAMTIFNPGIRSRRAEVMREYLAGSRALLDKYVERARNFCF